MEVLGTLASPADRGDMEQIERVPAVWLPAANGSRLLSTECLDICFRDHGRLRRLSLRFFNGY
jgi:hypothetical protein